METLLPETTEQKDGAQSTGPSCDIKGQVFAQHSKLQ